MKASFLFLCLAAAAAAQTAVPAPSAQPSRVVRSVVTSSPGQETPTEENPIRVNLDFKGGTPADLVAALSTAVGQQINVVIDQRDAKVQLPPVHVRNASLPSIFMAIASASTREVPVATSMHNGGTTSYSYRTVQNQFLPGDGTTGIDSVWSFVSSEPEMEEAMKLSQVPQRALRHFQLSQYLTDNLTVEDITTAVKTGWEMLGMREMPDLKFHKETGILIAAGDPNLLEQIPQVLQQLPSKNAAGETVPPAGISPAGAPGGSRRNSFPGQNPVTR
jgi:hypothetical protein